MHAVILAGGKGTRLKPYTTVFPKPLMPVGDMPILEVVLKQLKASGFNKITIAVGHLSKLIQTFFGDGEKLGLEIEYSLEDKPLGTAAPLKLIDGLPDVYLMMNGDILTTLDFEKLMDHHCQHDSLMTIATYNRKVHVDFGVLESDENGYVNNYVEKPTLNYNVSMGIYVFNKACLNFIPENTFFDLPDLVKILLKSNKKVGTYPFDGYWLDIGRPDDYATAVDEFESKRKKFLPWE